MKKEKGFIKNFIADSYKGMKYKKDERFAHVIITYDLNSATSTAYKEVDEQLRNCNFIKGIRFRPTRDNPFFDVFYLPKNTYAAYAMSKDYKNINALRDRSEKIIRDILDVQLKYGEADGYNYFVFTAKEWSFAAGEKYREIIDCHGKEEDGASKLLTKCTTCGLMVYNMENHIEKFHKNDNKRRKND